MYTACSTKYAPINLIIYIVLKQKKKKTPEGGSMVDFIKYMSHRSDMSNNFMEIQHNILHLKKILPVAGTIKLFNHIQIITNKRV